jgi:hypothetical protein
LRISAGRVRMEGGFGFGIVGVVVVVVMVRGVEV